MVLGWKGPLKSLWGVLLPLAREELTSLLFSHAKRRMSREHHLNCSEVVLLVFMLGLILLIQVQFFHDLSHPKEICFTQASR